MVIASVLFIALDLPECHRQWSNKQKNMQETFNKVALNKPPRVNVYEQFHPVKIIKAHLIPPKYMPQVTIL